MFENADIAYSRRSTRRYECDVAVVSYEGTLRLITVAVMCFPTLVVAQISLEKLRTCLEIEDQTKERLDCYDEKIKPAPKQVSTPAKTVQDCRFLKGTSRLL